MTREADLAALAGQATPGPWTRGLRSCDIEDRDRNLVAVASGDHAAAYIAACPPEVIAAAMDVIAKAQRWMDGVRTAAEDPDDLADLRDALARWDALP